jgi:hypothetical protein
MKAGRACARLVGRLCEAEDSKLGGCTFEAVRMYTRALKASNTLWASERFLCGGSTAAQFA